MAKQTYTTGQVLTAAQMTTLQANDYNWTVSAKTASYVLVAADAGTRITMSNAGATTITVNTALFTAGDTLTITNIGAGACTVTAGTATVSTAGSLILNQYDSGTLYFSSTSAAIWNGANPGDITGVTAGTGISGGGTSGTVTVSIDTAVTVDKTTAQTLTNKTLTSPALTTPTISTATTNGDLLYGTGSGALTRLGIGSNAQVLTVASGVPSWATPSSGGSTFSGVSAYRAAPDQAIASGTFTSINWTAENYDTDAFHDNTTNNTRLTIPTGKGGYYQIRAQAGMQGITGEFSLRVQKNGTNLRYFIGTGSTTDASQQINFATSLAAGDYITLDVLQSSGTSKNLFAGALYCWFELNYLGA